jgi:hypothetical protein
MGPRPPQVSSEPLARGGPKLPLPHVPLVVAPSSGGDPVLPRVLWCVT